MVATAETLLSGGLYTIDQTARLARLSPRILRRWLDGDPAGGEPALLRDMPKNDAQIFSFVDLVQALAIRALRKERRLSLQRIRVAINHAKELGIDYPFARQHQTYLFSDEVVLDVGGILVTVTGRHNRQQLMRPIAEPYLYDLSYDASGLANEYVPQRDGERRIVIRPNLRFGAPVVMPCGYTASTLINAFYSEGSTLGAAKEYDVTEDDVKFALRFDDFLGGIAA